MSTDQQALALEERPRSAADFALGYRLEQVAAARAHGLDSNRRGDPDLFDAAVRAIETLADQEWIFTATDVRSMLGGVAPPGAAFAHCRRRGVIVVVDATASSDVSRHGALVRTWRGSRWT